MRDTVCFRAASHQSSRKRKAPSGAVVIHGTANPTTISFVMQANKHDLFTSYQKKSHDSDEVENVKFDLVKKNIVAEGSSSDNIVPNDMIGALIKENITLFSTVSFKDVKLPNRRELTNLDKCKVSKVEDVEFDYDDNTVKLSDITQKLNYITQTEFIPKINGDQLEFHMTAKLVPIKTESARRI